MRLINLNARFIGSGGEGIFGPDGKPAPERTGVGVIMNCPCGCDHELYVPFKNPLDGKPPPDANERATWQRLGSTIDTLTLAPSVQRHEPCPKKWHGFIINGEARTC